MANNLTMNIKDLMLSLLQLYAEAESTLGFETDVKRAAEEIGGQAVKKYMEFVKLEKHLPFLDKAKARIMAGVEAGARLDQDPWDVCRTDNVRITFAYSIARIFEEEAGARHKFSIWSATVYSANKLLKGFKRGESHRGIDLLIAAPSKKKAVSMINNLLGSHETVSWANQHWTGGGTVGNKVATKIGIWAARDGYKTEEDYKLVWEPKI